MPNRYNAEVPAADKKERRQEGPAGSARRSWHVQEARARLSNLIEEALAGRPQRIKSARRGSCRNFSHMRHFVALIVESPWQ
jgi:hypothetical protein